MRKPIQKAELVLIDGEILCDPASPKAVPHGTTVISEGRLIRVNEPLDANVAYDEVIDCSNCLIMPGLVNAHTHAAMSLLRGAADDLPLDRWLNDYIFPSEARHAKPDFVHLGTTLSALEMALGGITTFADGYFHMEEAARATEEVGIRAVVAQGILDVPTPDVSSPGQWKQRAEQFLSDCPRNDLITPALFCHSPYLCAPETYVQAAELVAAYGGLLFSHVSETSQEVHDIKDRYGRTPVEHLYDLGVLGKRFVAVHAIHLTEREKDLLAETDTPVVHCPECNMKLASGAADVTGLLARGVTVGLGTDGPASNNNLDLVEEMRSASLMAKLVTGNPQALDAHTVIRMATIDGARVLGMDDRIGSLKRGKLADVIIVDLDRAHLWPVYDPLSLLVYSARGSDIRHVIVNGKLVVRNGRITTVNSTVLREKIGARASRICQDLGIRSTGGRTRRDRKDYI
jgi:5-methylthioadenosine/S-adenosylhomocysteine deaminase